MSKAKLKNFAILGVKVIAIMAIANKFAPPVVKKAIRGQM